MALQVLRLLSKPMPGLTSAAAVGKLTWWTIQLMSSPRLRECDAGALIMRAVFFR